MCTMLAHTCVVVVHVFMFIGPKSTPLPSCGSIALQMACNCSYPRNLLNASQVSKELFSAESVHYLSVCVSLGLSWDGESVLECQDIWRGKWVMYCMVRLDRCRVVPTGQDKAGGGILLPKDGPGMGMCN